MDDRPEKATSFCTLVLCQMIFHLGELKGEFYFATSTEWISWEPIA